MRSPYKSTLLKPPAQIDPPSRGCEQTLLRFIGLLGCWGPPTLAFEPFNPCHVSIYPADEGAFSKKIYIIGITSIGSIKLRFIC